MKKLPAFGVSLTVLAISAFGDEIYVPDSSLGNTSDSLFSFGPMVSARYQEVYDASKFLPINGGGLITGLSFRFENLPLVGSISNIQIDLSTTAKAVDALSTTFSQNVGGDDKKVFGPTKVTWFPTGGFSATFNFDTPFLYNPASGNLLVDIRIYNGGSVVGFGSLDMDAVRVLGDSVSTVVVDGAGSTGVSSLTGIADTGGMVTDFTVTPVPEPKTSAVAALAVSAAAAVRYWRRRRKATESPC